MRANAKAREDDLRLLEEKKRRSETFLAECMEANRLALKRKHFMAVLDLLKKFTFQHLYEELVQVLRCNLIAYLSIV